MSFTRGFRRVALSVAAAAAVAVGLVAQPAAASPPAQGGGTVAEVFRIPTDFRFLGCNPAPCSVVMISGIALDVYSGTLNGPVNATFTAVVDPTGAAHVRIEGTCDPCVVDGREGTVHVSLNIQDRTGAGGGVDGIIRADGLSGDLAGFHGIFDTGGFTYSGQYHFT
jgi:hypothetical protein